MQKQILNFTRHVEGISPVIGVVIMLFLTLLLAGITVSSVYGGDTALFPGKAPMASIEVESVVGGVPNSVKYEENFLYLMHKGGDPLLTDSTRIVICGEGSGYTGVAAHGGSFLYGELFVSYDDLTINGKDSPYASNNPDILDGVWSAGEKVILSGHDSPDGSSPSSVHVAVNGMTNTSDNYGLKETKMVSIKIFDMQTQCIISELECLVILAD
ncbi:type IV pilin N-terminal domain-containing protein [Methanolobus mangrovi]|uniref:Type IV pilin N-terminal domain-containing protein n=1 Tax=Methanolobus mangrovi TaxID=3072977 RepID=A0AA51UEW8_9EURY|nr:type IV pilin N-terminal domain-containing protein [Methanolobus mangrovi]WMW21883.1 type IV pilin N-terminal domain-containing protein [Methanolobus mangrovi]